jgi:hypothetical protein
LALGVVVAPGVVVAVVPVSSGAAWPPVSAGGAVVVCDGDVEACGVVAAPGVVVPGAGAPPGEVVVVGTVSVMPGTVSEVCVGTDSAAVVVRASLAVLVPPPQPAITPPPAPSASTARNAAARVVEGV